MTNEHHQLWTKHFPETQVIVVLGNTGCLPKGTMIKTIKGDIPIEKIEKEVLTYNLKKRNIESKRAVLYNSGLKQIVKLYTEAGLIRCSPEHKWVVIREKNLIEEIQTKDLKTTDMLLLVKGGFTNETK